MNDKCAANELRIPEIGKKKKGAYKIALACLLYAFLIAILTPFLGAITLLVIKLFRAIFDLLPSIKNATTLLFVFYFVVATIAILIANLVEVGDTMIKTVDHLAIRMLSILVVGGSDLARGRTWIAAVLYVSLGGLLITAAFSYFSFVLDGTEIGHKTQQIFLGTTADFSDVLEALLGGALLALGVLVSILPIMMVFSKRWKVMIRRPRFSVISNAGLQSGIGHQKRVIIAHASDLHALPPVPDESVNDKLRMGIRGLATANVQAIILTGDLTDNGSQEAWNALLSTPEIAQLKDRAVLAPGNHDLNAVYSRIWEAAVKLEHPRRIGTQGRALNYLRAANLIMGSRTMVICPYSRCRSTLTDVMIRAGDDIKRWENDEKLRPKALVPEQLLEKIFPMLVEVPGVECGFMVWNSVKLNRWPLLNAIGEVDRSQLERANTLLSHSSANKPLIHLIHHQIGVPQTAPLAHDESIPWWKRIFAIGMGLQNPADFLNWLGERSQRTIVLHGHHHKYFLLEHAESMARIVSSPSLTYGVETTYSGDVETGEDGRWLALTLLIDGPNVELSRVDVQEIKAEIVEGGQMSALQH